MVRVHERGSIVGYIVVGVLLATAVVGGVYVVKHQAPKGAEVSTTQNADTSDKKQATPDDKSTSTTKPADSKPTPNPTATPDAADTAQRPDTAQPTAPSTDSTTTTPPATDQTVATPSELPTTGPTNLTAVAAILAIVTGATLLYRRSNSL